MRTLDIMTAIVFASVWAGVGMADPTPLGEAKLAKALQGRVAEKPVQCLTLHRARHSRIIDRTAVIFEAGRTLYVNRPIAGAEALSDSKALLIKSVTPQICRGGAVELFDAASRFTAGSIFLGDFVPYVKRPIDRPSPESRGYSGQGYSGQGY